VCVCTVGHVLYAVQVQYGSHISTLAVPVSGIGQYSTTFNTTLFKMLFTVRLFCDMLWCWSVISHLHMYMYGNADSKQQATSNTTVYEAVTFIPTVDQAMPGLICQLGIHKIVGHTSRQNLTFTTYAPTLTILCLAFRLHDIIVLLVEDYTTSR
jgi:hypothetical protein